ncbi:hypothetical protein HanPI659440_Chr13g0484691 [Helianthus annuus]|nr:hypothetical protein HanPI659440_Chr13g0484691 [Helianthus annuus]
MDHPWKNYDVAPTWRIILQGRTITIPSSLRKYNKYMASFLYQVTNNKSTKVEFWKYLIVTFFFLYRYTLDL